jgi:hypothetical protein
MEAMALQEFQQWTEETECSFWAQIMTPGEARGYRNTLAPKLVEEEEGPDGEVGKAPFNVTQHRIGSIKSRLWELRSCKEQLLLPLRRAAYARKERAARLRAILSPWTHHFKLSKHML